MAIPLSMPNSDDIDESQRLDFLLEQLLITLRQVLIHRRRAAAGIYQSSHVRHSRHSTAEQTTEEEAQLEESTRVTGEEEAPPASVQLPLPDLVMNSPATKESAYQEHHSHLNQHHNYHHQEERDRLHRRSRPEVGSWVEDSGELIRLAGRLLDQEDEEAQPNRKRLEEESELDVLSLMCPLLGNSVWTTVALLVVWGLLSRAR